MTLEELETIFKALNDSKVRYLVAGGIAVNIHGYQRATADLDLVIQLNQSNLLNAIHALKQLGYRSILPVKEEELADQETRQHWIRDRNMQVFSLHSDRLQGTTIDIFVTCPFDFDSEFQAANVCEIAAALEIRVVSINTLIEMKTAAGRPRDLDDIEHLEMISNEKQK